ncbi:MAG: HDOD domain-containing protein [Fuerstiella sp.]
MAATEKSSSAFGDYCAQEVVRLKDIELPDDLQIPSLPTTLTEFLEASNDPDCSLKHLGGIVGQDPGMTVDLLKCANYNSASLGRPIRDATEALTRVGLKKSRDYLMAAGVKAATMVVKSKLINFRNFWNESLRRALFAKTIAKRLKLDEDLAFIGGLLQDFVLPILTNQYDDRYLYYLKEVAPKGATLARWESDSFGWNHAEVGALMAHRWNLPDDLLCSILLHHKVEQVLESEDVQMFTLFPANVAAMLPDQLQQTPNGIRELIDIDAKSGSVKLDEVAAQVDLDLDLIAEGKQRPQPLGPVIARARTAAAAE